MQRPSESELKRSAADTEAQGKIERAKPTWDSFKSELGSALTVTETPDGKINGRVEDHTPDKRHLKRLYAMTREAKRLEMDLGAEIQSRSTFVPLRDKRGALDFIREDIADSTARKGGLRPVIRWGQPSQPDARGCWRNGHTHLNDDPAEWQRRGCPGCNGG